MVELPSSTRGIHTIDLLQHIMGPVNAVFGVTRTISHNIEGEDLGDCYPGI